MTQQVSERSVPVTVVWEEPPADGRTQRSTRAGTDVYAQFAEALRERPGVWARFQIKGTSARAGNLAVTVRRGKLAAFRPVGDFEAVSRKIVDSDGNAVLDSNNKQQFGVWVRFVGPTED